MDENDTRTGAAWRRPSVLLALLVGVPLWLLAAHLLWRSSVPSGLQLSGLDPHAYFGARFLARSASYERFLAVESLLAALVVLAVLALYARFGQRLMRESAAGPIGTGMMLGMLGLGVVWLAEVPFELVALWWERRHGVSHQGYVSALTLSFLGLVGPFLAISFALLIAMFLARVLRDWWWLVAAPFFAGLALLTAFAAPLLNADTVSLSARPGYARTAADARALARQEGVAGTKVVVQEVDAPPNAAASGFGATKTVMLESSLLRRRRFDRAEVRVVLAHEFGHLRHRHILKGVGWLTLFLLPVAGLIVLATRRRGGLARPEAVPVALLVLVAASLLATPLLNLATRRLEAEADWAALQTTRDPAAMRSLMRDLSVANLGDPDPPAWLYVLGENHPTAMQRIAMARAWEAERR